MKKVRNGSGMPPVRKVILFWLLFAIFASALTCAVFRNDILEAMGRHALVNGICSRCGLVTEAHVHHWDEGTVEQEPGCVSEGLIRYVCVECSAEYTEILPAAGHTAVQGSEYCGVCGEKTHSHEDEECFANLAAVTTDCTQDGLYNTTCAICGYVKESYTVAAFGHSFDQMTGVCSRCGLKNTDIWRLYGEGLTDLPELDRIRSIVSYVNANCTGNCIDYSAAQLEAAGGAGIRAVYRDVRCITCPVTGGKHTDDVFNEEGFCVCGLGIGHTWVRYYLSDGTWYEADAFLGDTGPVSMPNTSRWGSPVS